MHEYGKPNLYFMWRNNFIFTALVTLRVWIMYWVRKFVMWVINYCRIKLLQCIRIAAFQIQKAKLLHAINELFFYRSCNLVTLVNLLHCYWYLNIEVWKRGSLTFSCYRKTNLFANTLLSFYLLFTWSCNRNPTENFM